MKQSALARLERGEGVPRKLRLWDSPAQVPALLGLHGSYYFTSDLQLGGW